MKHSALFPITLIAFLDVLAFAMVMPMLPFYAQDLGATPAQVGALIATYAVFALFSGPLLGRAADRFGRKPILLLSQVGSLLGFAMLALAPSLVWLFVGRALDGVTAGNLLAARAYISDVTAPKDRSAAFGLIAAAFGFGYLVGPAGSALLSSYGHALPLWTATALALLGLISTLVMLPSTRPLPSVEPPLPARLLFQLPGVGARLAQWFAFLIAFSLFTSGFAMYAERRLDWDGHAFGPIEVGVALAWLGALGLVAQLVVLRRVVARFGEARVVEVSAVVAAIGYGLLATTHDVVLLALALSLAGLGVSLLRPALLGLISNAVPPSRQGLVFGVTNSLQSIALILAPLVAGGLIHVGWIAAWALCCAAALVVARLIAPRGAVVATAA
ncbi:MAG: major facilitator superfamily 1 [Panacagrimonas sp.]|jgi:MFS family permease|nr:MFS transporter [Panacagrimonas sp.]MCC2655208.1 major facilitator superfamily 1 [Panacagrimonas sp.]